jgi:hypothetical protein
MKYTESDIDAKMTKILSDVDVSLLSNIIVPIDNGYMLFEHYSIQRHKHGARVTKYGNEIAEFTSPKIALSWCIADKYNQLSVSIDIIKLDQRRKIIKEEFEATKQRLNAYRNPEVLDTIEAKLSYKQQLLADVETRLNKCANLAKYWQTRGFNDEIARIRRSASNQTNRPGIRKPSWSQD